MRGFSFVISGMVMWYGSMSCWAAPAEGNLPQHPSPADTEVPLPPPPASFDNARFSLSLQNVSLPVMLQQVSMATSLQFRYAAPPDVMLSASFRNAPLFPSLEKALRPEGFSLLRDGRDAWLLRAYPRPIAALSLTPQKNEGNPAKEVSSSKAGGVASAALLNASPAGLATSVSVPFDGWAMRAESQPGVGQAKVREKTLALEADAREFPGVTVLIPDEKAVARSKSGVRYTLFLRHVPERLRLALDTPLAASLKVNGATLRRSWSGLAEFELSGALRPGLNNIEVCWKVVIPEGATVEGATSADGAGKEDDHAGQEMAKPLLRYEWLSGNEPPPANTATLPLPGGFRLLLGRSEWEK